MSILIDENSKILVQGFTGAQASFHSELCIKYGSKIVGGVVPSKGGQIHLNLPVFDTMQEGVKQTGADVSLIFVPAKFLASSIIEAADSGIKLAVIITEHAPIKDMIFAKNYALKKKMALIGPNCPGVISSNKCKLGIMPGEIFKLAKKNIGLISKSGTLTYEGASEIINQGYGISTAVGIGGDAIIGLTYKEILPMFEKDDETDAIVLIGEIGGDLEKKAASIIKNEISKPIVAFIAGSSAPVGKRMGHAGAIINSLSSTAQDKKKVLKEVGVRVVDSPTQIGATLKEILC